MYGVILDGVVLEAALPQMLSSGRSSEEQVAELFRSFKRGSVRLYAAPPRKEHIGHCVHIYTCIYICVCVYIYILMLIYVYAENCML